MKYLIPLVALLLGGCFVRAPSAYDGAAPAVSVSVASFDPYLDPYGAWMTVPGYGRVWQPSPRYVGTDFYPYGSGGRWVYTNAGWVFDSEYPFGWAVFHYGRWMREPNYGWVWLPGTQWGPSWVSWRMGGPYVGWAPLGPRGVLSSGYRDWCFVPVDRFTVRNVRAYSAHAYDFHRAVAVTQPWGRERMGPPPRVISQATGRRIEPRPLRDLRTSGRRVPPPPRGYGDQPRSVALPPERLGQPPSLQPGRAPASPGSRALPRERFERKPSPQYRGSPRPSAAPPPLMRRSAPPPSSPAPAPPPMRKGR